MTCGRCDGWLLKSYCFEAIRLQQENSAPRQGAAIPPMTWKSDQKRRSISCTHPSNDSPLRARRVPRHACHRTHDPEHHGERYTLVTDESHIFTS